MSTRNTKIDTTSRNNIGLKLIFKLDISNGSIRIRIYLNYFEIATFDPFCGAAPHINNNIGDRGALS